jgi:hypothetical protein
LMMPIQNSHKPTPRAARRSIHTQPIFCGTALASFPHGRAIEEYYAYLELPLALGPPRPVPARVIVFTTCASLITGKTREALSPLG